MRTTALLLALLAAPPPWVRTGASPDHPRPRWLTAAGAAGPSGDPGHDREIAAVRARAEAARALSSRVRSRLLAREVSGGGEAHVEERTEVWTDVAPGGVPVVARWRSPEGREWALAALDRRALTATLVGQHRAAARRGRAAAERLGRAGPAEVVGAWLSARDAHERWTAATARLHAVGVPSPDAPPPPPRAPALVWGPADRPVLRLRRRDGSEAPVPGAGVVLLPDSGAPPLRLRTDGRGAVTLPAVHPGGALAVEGGRGLLPETRVAPARPRRVLTPEPTRCHAVRPGYWWCRAAGVVDDRRVERRAPGRDRASARAAAEAELRRACRCGGVPSGVP